MITVFPLFRVVFDIHSSDTPQVRASSSKSYNLTDDEKTIIEELRLWTLQQETLNKKFAITSLKDLSTSQTFINLLAQVVVKSHTKTGSIALTLWDGSLPGCQSVLVEPISEEGQIMSDELMRKAAKRSVDVFLFDNHVTGDVRRICPGDFVCIRNVHLKEKNADDNLTANRPQVMYIILTFSLPESIMETCSVLLTFEILWCDHSMKPLHKYFCIVQLLFQCFTK